MDGYERISVGEEMDKEAFLAEWDYFCDRINFKQSFLDARAITFMNNFKRNLDEIAGEKK